MMAEIRDDLKKLRSVLLGNGSEGIIHQYQRRIQSVEDWKNATSSALRGVAKPPDNGAVAYLRQVPWWGWLVLTSTLGPEGWRAIEALISMAKSGGAG